jgi:hypothetical protein
MKFILNILFSLPFIASAIEPAWQNPFLEYPFHSTRTENDIIVIVINDCDPIEWDYGIPMGYGSMRELWDSICSEDAHFTVRAGDEYLIYSRNTLTYSKGDIRNTIFIYPEELWVIMSHFYMPLSPATGEISMQAWFPGMAETETTFITAHHPAMTLIQELLQRGRDS